MTTTLEATTARYARQLLTVAAEGSGQAGAQRDLGSALARLMGELLATDERWPRSRWVDDVLFDACAPSANDEITFAGRLIWGKGGTTMQWTSPCRGWLRVSDADLAAFSLQVGDAAQPEGLPYPKRPRRAADPEWQFSFDCGPGRAD